MSTYSIIKYKSSELPKQYQSMVLSKWLRSLRHGNPLFKSIDSIPYYRQYQQYIELLLSRPNSIIRLAVLTDEPDTVLGFSVARDEILDYIYVNGPIKGLDEDSTSRRKGIGRMLMPKTITTMTHVTLTAIDIWRNNPKYKKLKFNPFA